VRNQSLDAVCRAASVTELLAECAELEAFRHRSENLYERVRALLFLYAIHRFSSAVEAGSSRPDPDFVFRLHASVATPV